MMYVHGVQEDADDHERICVEYKLGVRLGQAWKQERVAWTQSKKGDRIIEIRPTDPVHHRKKVRQVKAIVDDELGFVSQSINKQAANQFSIIQCGQNEIENGADLYGKTAFLYIDSKSNRVVGLCTAHVIKKAFLLITQEENGIPHNNNGSICRSTVPVRAMVGVHQIWVHKSHRTKGIATYLVDAVRSRLIYGCTIPPDQVAFSSPTADGAAFAKRYMGVDKSGGNDNSNVLIYDAHT
jgi:N-acetyltransferase